MKIYLDLLPDSKKREIFRKKRLKTIINQELFFLVPIVLFAIILFDVNLVLDIKNEGLNKNLESVIANDGYKDLKFYEDNLETINKKIVNINNLQEKHFRWSVIINMLIEVMPPNVYLTELSTKDYQVFLVGKAKQREALINFQEKMKQTECFENINTPLSNLVAKSDIDFQMDFQIKKDCLVMIK